MIRQEFRILKLIWCSKQLRSQRMNKFIRKFRLLSLNSWKWRCNSRRLKRSSKGWRNKNCRKQKKCRLWTLWIVSIRCSRKSRSLIGLMTFWWWDFYRSKYGSRLKLKVMIHKAFKTSYLIICDTIGTFWVIFSWSSVYSKAKLLFISGIKTKNDQSITQYPTKITIIF